MPETRPWNKSRPTSNGPWPANAPTKSLVTYLERHSCRLELSPQVLEESAASALRREVVNWRSAQRWCSIPGDSGEAFLSSRRPRDEKLHRVGRRGEARATHYRALTPGPAV